MLGRPGRGAWQWLGGLACRASCLNACAIGRLLHWPHTNLPCLVPPVPQKRDEAKKQLADLQRARADDEGPLVQREAALERLKVPAWAASTLVPRGATAACLACGAARRPVP